MLLFALLKKFVHLILKFLSECIHFILLFLHKLGLCCKDFLVAKVHVILAFLLLKLVCFLLHLVSLLVVFLLGEILLNFAHVKEFCRLFEFKWECFF